MNTQNSNDPIEIEAQITALEAELERRRHYRHRHGLPPQAEQTLVDELARLDTELAKFPKLPPRAEDYFIEPEPDDDFGDRVNKAVRTEVWEWVVCFAIAWLFVEYLLAPALKFVLTALGVMP